MFTGMLQTYNIDRNDASINTNAPFKHDCKLLLGKVTVPAAYILSIKLYLYEGQVPPVKISQIHTDAEFQDRCVVTFKDSAGSKVGYWRPWLNSTPRTKEWPYITGWIRDDYGVIVGHIAYDPALPGLLLAAARNADGLLKVSEDDFILLPQCHVAWLAGGCKSISINDGIPVQTNVDVKFGILVHTDVTEALSISIVDAYMAKSLRNGLCELTGNFSSVNGISGSGGSIWIGGQHLVLRHAITSNLRVLNADYGVQLVGVKDV